VKETRRERKKMKGASELSKAKSKRSGRIRAGEKCLPAQMCNGPNTSKRKVAALGRQSREKKEIRVEVVRLPNCQET